jgi:hypothetical protein
MHRHDTLTSLGKIQTAEACPLSPLFSPTSLILLTSIHYTGAGFPLILLSASLLDSTLGILSNVILLVIYWYLQVPNHHPTSKGTTSVEHTISTALDPRIHKPTS